MIAAFPARLNDVFLRFKAYIRPLKWLVAPSGSAVEFALRNTIASLVALGIAFWMELGEPQWAAMTVWITAQGSRGESLSKGRWRLVGTMMGMVGAVSLVALVPQAPWLFIPGLALWAGMCTGFATLCQNFRAYAFVLAGYTCAIITTGALSAPDHVFEITMARGTYIFLGVLCEMVAGVVFSASLAVKARRTMRAWLVEAIGAASTVMGDVLDGMSPPETAIRAVFSRTLKLNEQLEFTVVEVGRSDRAVACAYATIGVLSQIVSRALGMQARLLAVPTTSERVATVVCEMSQFLRALPSRLESDAAITALRAELASLKRWCAGSYQETLEDNAPRFVVDDRIILHGLRLILEEYEILLAYFQARPEEALTPARFRLKRVLTWRVALHNAVRSAIAICLAGLIWEVTAWSQGAAFISFVAVVVGGFATTDNTVLVSKRFLQGACFAALASIVPVFFIIPIGSGFEALVIGLAPLMFIGGLAARNPATAAAAGSYNTFFPAMVGLANHTRINELTWFNSTLALLFGLGAGGLVFRCILPFNVHQVCLHLRRQTFQGLYRICKMARASSREARWIGLITQGMERVIRYTGGRLTPFIELNLHGLLSIMTLGRNLLFLRKLVGKHHLPAVLDDAVRAFFLGIEGHGMQRAYFGQKLDELIETVRVEALRAPAVEDASYSEVLGSLLVIQHEWRGNAAWLDEQRFRQALQNARMMGA